MKYFSLHFAIVFLLSLSIVGQDNVSFGFDDITIQKITGEKIQTNEMLRMPVRLMVYNNYLIIMNENIDLYFDVFCLESNKVISKFGSKGAGPNELGYALAPQIVPASNELWVYDFAGKKMVCFTLSVSDQKLDVDFNRSFRTKNAVIKTPVKLNNFFICTLLGDRDGYRFCLMDEKGEEIDKFSSFPDIGINYPTFIADNIFYNNPVAVPGKQKIILAYRNWDRIELIDISGNTELILTGPLYTKPDIHINGYEVTLTDKNPQTYWYPCTGDESFMVPYSGKNITDEPFFNKILHFDYSGKLIHVFELVPKVNDIVVDWQNRIIYGINREFEPALYKYKF
jgi:hypothetical protein